MIKTKFGKIGEFLLCVVGGISIGLLTTRLVVCKVTVDGVSMNPTYQTGDTLLINRLANPKRGEVVTFTKDNKNFIKRIIAVPGDTLSIANSKVSVNGEVIKEDYIYEDVFEGGKMENCEYVLGEDEYFVMGDNRNNSLDSRIFGVIHREDIIGTKLFDLG